MRLRLFRMLGVLHFAHPCFRTVDIHILLQIRRIRNAHTNHKLNVHIHKNECSQESHGNLKWKLQTS